MKNKRQIIITDCHDCSDWCIGEGDNYGTICGATSEYKVVEEQGEIALIPDWCPKLKRNDI